MGAYTPHRTWEDIHLEAQIQAVLYSLRMIKQILQYITSSATEEPLPGELLELAAELGDLPLLAGLMPSPFELREAMGKVDIDDVMEKLAALLQEEVGDEERFGEVVKEGFGNQAADVAAPTPIVGKKKKRKKKKEEKEECEVVDKGGGDNMFRVLA